MPDVDEHGVLGLRAWAGTRTAQLEATAVLCWHAQLRYEEPTVRQANYDGAAAARVCAFRGVGGGRITIRWGSFHVRSWAANTSYWCGVFHAASDWWLRRYGDSARTDNNHRDRHGNYDHACHDGDPPNNCDCSAYPDRGEHGHSAGGRHFQYRIGNRRSAATAATAARGDIGGTRLPPTH